MSTNELTKDKLGMKEFSSSEMLSPEELEQLKKENEVIEDKPKEIIRKEKIRELKEVIKMATEEYRAMVEKYRTDKINETLTDETKKEYEQAIGTRGAVIEGLREELKMTRMNKNSSSFFEWHPSAPNRRTRRLFSKMRRV
jgi:hypothetical protein